MGLLSHVGLSFFSKSVFGGGITRLRPGASEKKVDFYRSMCRLRFGNTVHNLRDGAVLVERDLAVRLLALLRAL